MRSLALSLLLVGFWVAPSLAQGDPNHHHHHHQHEHQHELGPAGTTYDLRWLDAMVQHHTGALRMGEFVFNIGSPGVGALAHDIWREQAREIKAMGQWRKAWYPEAPMPPVALKAGGDPNSMAGLEAMGSARIEAMQMMGATPTNGA
jgi:uncharacterized protein (DUF305 family)